MDTNPITIIAIDGTASSGKGTIAFKLSEHFGLHYLNSGALYRLATHLALESGISIENPSTDDLVRITKLMEDLDMQDVKFVDKKVLYKGQDIWPVISSQAYGNMTAKIAPYPPLRKTVSRFERNCIVEPGLVAEGRNMCTEVFADAKVKLYLDASLEVRARRRLIDEEKIGSGKTFEILYDELEKRDYADKNRAAGALRVADDAKYIDTSNLTREEVLDVCIAWCKEKGVE